MKNFTPRLLITALISATALALSACGGSQLAAQTAAPAGALLQASPGAWPQGLPRDARQPWEVAGAKSASFDPDSELLPGVERFLEGSGVSDLGEASHLDSGVPGARQAAWAIYRLDLGGAQPGALALDVNLLADQNSGASSYYVGVSDYASLRWEWHGPYSDSHVRLAHAAQSGSDVLASSDYVSDAGHSFVAVLCFDGSRVDALALSAEPLDGADSTAPPQPAGLAASPIAGGLALQWNSVIAADLAGYRVYYSRNAFSSPQSAGVQHQSYIEGSTRQILGGISGSQTVRISAIDSSGNESPLSDPVIASPLAGTLPALQLTLSQPSMQRGDPGTLSVDADSALLLDYDMDGDGVFEISGSSQSSQALDTSAPGIIRPRVRASSGDGSFQALGGVSLLVSANARPLASGTVAPASGPAPLQVNFDGTDSKDSDGDVVGGGWDFDGDGIFDAFDDASLSQLALQHTYVTPGLYNARLAVVDDLGATDIEVFSVLAEGPQLNLPPLAILSCDTSPVLLGRFDSSSTPVLSAAASYDPEGSTLEFAFDFEGDGIFTSYGATAAGEPNYDSPGNYLAAVKVRDSGGAEAIGYCLVRVLRFQSVVPTSGHTIANNMSITALQSNLTSRIGIAYNNSSADDLLFICSTDMLGTDWLGPITVDSNGGEWVSLIQNASQFNLAYYRDGDLFFKASQNDGGSFNVSGNIDLTAADAGNYCSCAVVGGRPAVSYFNATSGALYYARATNTSGSAWGSPVLVDDTGVTGMHTSLAIVGGRPAVAYYRQDADNLMYVRASDADGTAWGSPVQVETSPDDIGQFSSMTVVDGNPAILSYNVTQAEVDYFRATDATGSAWAAAVDTGAGGGINSLQLLLYQGRPLLIFGNGTATGFAQAADAQGGTWGQSESIEGNQAATFACMSVNADNLPVAAYYDSVGLELHFASPRTD